MYLLGSVVGGRGELRNYLEKVASLVAGQKNQAGSDLGTSFLLAVFHMPANAIQATGGGRSSKLLLRMSTGPIVIGSL